VASQRAVEQSGGGDKEFHGLITPPSSGEGGCCATLGLHAFERCTAVGSRPLAEQKLYASS